MLMTYIAYLVLMPFGYGFISAELTAGFTVWRTIQQWDYVITKYHEGLEMYM